MALHVSGLTGPMSRGQLARLRSSGGPKREDVQAAQPSGSISANVGQAFEQALEITWQAVPPEHFAEFTVEVVYDNQDPKRGKSDQPKELVQQVDAGTDTKAWVRGLPSGRRFLCTVIGRMRDNNYIRSPWVRAMSLAHKERSDRRENLDPNSQPRRECTSCSCSGYVYFATSAMQYLCRRCGCSCRDHISYETKEVLRDREARACKKLGLAKVKELPDEAIEWDDRECELWFGTAGAFHPRNAVPRDRRVASTGLKGLVSVVTPTTEGRQHFHLWLWSCFAAQSWPDKELVVVETYTGDPSSFLQHMSKSDPRLVYYGYKISEAEEADWSIGVKRNIGNHLAKGEFIASFDDDDLYAPDYLSTMVSAMELRKGQAIKLSSWYIFKTATYSWGFCDPIAWGMSRGLDLTDTLVGKFTYGYGFSYVYRRQVALEVRYEDINFGEDFAFLSEVRRQKGDESVLLLRDDSGICLHVQHGTNTSNSMAVREVPREEALDTAVMELSSHFASLGLTQIDSHPAGLFFGMKAAPSKRVRKVRVHLPKEKEITIAVWTNATTEAFLKELWAQTGQMVPWQVYRVPPPGEAEEEKRDIIAALLLGIAYLIDLPGTWMNLLPHTSSGQQWLRLLEEAKRPLRPSDSLGLRTTSLWLVPGEENSEIRADEEIIPEDYVLINATVHKPKKQCCSCFVAWLPRGTTVELLRSVLGRSLPAQARILIERPGKGMAVLQNGEVVPERIVVSEYSSNQPFRFILNRNQAKVMLLLMRKYGPEPRIQRKLDEMDRESNGNTFARRGLLGKVLNCELYPAMCRHLGLPENALDAQNFAEELVRYIGADLEMSHLWLEVDWWIRNWDGVQSAFAAINRHRSVWGLGELTDIFALDPTRRAQRESGHTAPPENLAEGIPAAAHVPALEADGPPDPADPAAAPPPAESQHPESRGGGGAPEGGGAAAAAGGAAPAGAPQPQGPAESGHPRAEPGSPRGVDPIFDFSDLPEDI